MNAKLKSKTQPVIIRSRTYPVYFEFRLSYCNAKGEAIVEVSAFKTIEEQREDDTAWDPYIFYRRRLCEGGRLNDGRLVFASEASLVKTVKTWYRKHMQNLMPSNVYNSYY